MYDHQEIEQRRQREWAAADVYKTPALDQDCDYKYIKASAPFTSGDIHMGHVRSYSIGDAYARFLRARGDAVLLAWGYDAFGLPAEMTAEKNNIDPASWVDMCSSRMTKQLQRLGFSFDWDRTFLSSDPQMYRWSQWLFLTLLEADLIYRDKAEVNFCAYCGTALADMQVIDGRCWRCDHIVGKGISEQWYLRVSEYKEELDEWLTILRDTTAWDSVSIHSQQAVAQFASDWTISRDRQWGTPIPLVWCSHCQAHFALPKTSLPFDGKNLYIEDRCCKNCGTFALTPAVQTLDCHFDALWLWIVPTLNQHPGSMEDALHSADVRTWLPAHRIVAGSDSGNFMYNQRAVTKMLRDLGWLNFDEPFTQATLHEMVLAPDGKKMSKSAGNVVDPDDLVREYGADAVRLAILSMGGPAKAISWNEDKLVWCHHWLNEVWNVSETTFGTHVADDGDGVFQTKHLHARLQKWTAMATHLVTRELDALQMHKAVNHMVRFFGLIKMYISEIEERRDTVGGEDLIELQVAMWNLYRLLAPFAPHIAEELWLKSGRHGTLGWPELY